VQAPVGRLTLSTADPYEGTANARFEVRTGDVEPETGSARSEISGPTFEEGQDIFVRDAIKVPAANTFSGSWQIIQQLHENDWGGSPGIAVFLDSDLQIHMGAGDGSPSYWEGPRLEKERWYDLVYRVHLSRDPAAGFVEVWLDGQQQTLVNGETRAYGQTIQTESTYLKVGIYRSSSSTGTSVVEHDEIVVGTSLESVLGA
jgi:Polysaccharide lyase